LLPSELALAACFSVSRITVKRALDALQTEALLSRRVGRGSHITEAARPHTILRAPLTGNLESLNVMGRETTVEVLSFERVPAPARICVALKLKPDTLVDRAIRVRRHQGEPFAFYVSHTLVLDTAGALEHTAMTQKSLKTRTRLDIFRDMGIKLAEVDQVLNATTASPEAAHALSLPIGAPVLSLTRTYIDRDGRTVDHLVGLYRPDRFEYHMHLFCPDKATHKNMTMERRKPG
jgi:GntR family transcriptional regulator